MNTFCPLYKNKEVFDKFNEMIETFGGKPMTEDEFKSSELRKQRSGLDLSAVETAYTIYDLNKGHFLDEAPNGNKSILYDQILNLTNQDRQKAFQIKSDIYTEQFKEQYGDWLNDKNIKIKLDINGEPILSEFVKKEQKIINVTEQLFNDETSLKLNNGDTVYTNDIITDMIDNNIFDEDLMEIARILSIHNIGVKYNSKLGNTVFGETVIDDNGKATIELNPILIQRLSTRYASRAFIHEIVHAITDNALFSPSNLYERSFQESNKKIYNIFDKLFPETLYTRIDDMYGLKNEAEFASEFITNKDFRSILYKKAQELDNKRFNSILRNFVNKISKIFINKSILKSNIEKLNDYEKSFNDLLLNKTPIKNGQVIDNIDLWKAVTAYNNNKLSEDSIFDDFKILGRQIDNIKSAPYVHIVPQLDGSENNDEYNKNIQRFAKDASSYLTLRLKALMASNLPEYFKSKNKQILQQQISMFNSGQEGIYNAIIYLLNQSIPQLTQDCEQIKDKFNSGVLLSSDSYMYQMHDNFGTYQRLYNELDALLESSFIREILAKQISTKGSELDDNIKSILSLKQQVQNAKSIAESGTNCLKQILIKSMRYVFTQIGNETHDPTMADYLEQLVIKQGDTSWFTQYMGATDKADDNALRSLSYILNKAINASESATLDKATKLLNLQKNLAFGESVKDLYEFDENGITTGYLVRDLNFGQFENDYLNFLKGDKKAKKGSVENIGLNLYISKKYGVILESDNRQPPENDDDARKEWLHLQNEWLDKHCERQYTKEYYELFNNLSKLTRDARSNIQQQIDSLKSECLGDDGFFHYDNLSPQQYKILQSLYIQKRLLQSDYDINGNLKEEGTDAYKIAKELQELNSKIKPSSKTVQLNYEAWKNQRAIVIDECGGKKEYEKYLNGEENSFDIKTLNKWDRFNSKYQFKRDEEGKTILFKHIDDIIRNEFGGDVVYDVDGDGGAQYESLKKQLNELYSSYRDRNTGDLLYNMIPRNIKSKIKEINKELGKIKRKAVAQDKRLRQIQKRRRELYRMYTKSVPTEVYNKMREWATSNLDLDAYDDFINSTHDEIIDWISGQPTGEIRLKREYSKLVARDEYKDEYMELLPGDGYMESNKNNEYVNKNFEALKKYDRKWVPKKSIKRYDNTKAFMKVLSSRTLMALYDEIVNTMSESNKFYKREFYDNYLLPQITGSLYKRLKNQSGKWRHALDYVKESLGFGLQSSLQNNEYGISSENKSQLDETLTPVNPSEENNILLSGTRPDGRSLGMIPMYYTKKLDNPGQLSADLIGIVCEYYNKAHNFNQKKEIQNRCESIVDMLQNRKVMKNKYSSKHGKTQEEIAGINSRSYQTAKKFLEMNLYNKRMNTNIFNFNLFGKTITFNSTVFLALAKNSITAVNLGMSPVVALVGGFSTMFSHIVQSITGQKYGLREATQAGMQTIFDLIKTSPLTLTGTVVGGMLINPIFGVPAGIILGSIFDKYLLRQGIIQNRLSNNLTVGRMEMFGISDQLRRKYTHSNRSEIINTVNDNWCYGAMTMIDFVVKSQIMNSVLMSYRFYNGEFCTKEDLKINYINKPYKEYKTALKEWNKGVSLYSIHEMQDGKIGIRKGYEQYEHYFKIIEDIVKHRILNYCESSDGMQSETQKSAIMSNVFGAFVLMHRQYLPVMLQERFGNANWDESMQQLNGGIYKEAFNLNMLKAFTSAVWMGSIDAFAGQKNFHDSFNERFYKDTETPFEKIKRRYGLYKLKQVSTELILINAILSPLIALLESYIKDDDDDDNKLLNLLLYVQYRSLWEAKTPYLFDDLFNNIKTVSAGTSGTDKVQNLLESVSRTYFPDISNSLYDTFFSRDIKEYDEYVKKGAYKDDLKVVRDLIKLTPYHNVYEQYNDSENKLRYFKNQVMKVSE